VSAGVLAALVGLWVTVRFLHEWAGVIVVEGLKPPGANIKRD
jgi:hypothetical protein